MFVCLTTYTNPKNGNENRSSEGSMDVDDDRGGVEASVAIFMPKDIQLTKLGGSPTRGLRFLDR